MTTKRARVRRLESGDASSALRVEPFDARIARIVERGASEWQQTFDAIASPVLVLDPSGVVRRLNRAARDLAGLSFPAAVGAPVGDLAFGEPWKLAAELATRAAKDRANVTASARDVGSGRTWDVEASFLGASDPDADRVIVVARDLTKLVDLQESLRRSETLSTLGTLLAGVAHEVRNPLFGISATLDALRARLRGAEDVERYFDVLRVEVQRLKALMSDLLDLGRPASSEPPWESSEGVLDEAVRLCRPLAKERGVELRVDAKAERLGRTAALRVDRSRMTRLLLNLIENAVYHAPPDSVVEAVAYRDGREATGGPLLVYEVLDRGPGFAPADLPKVFEPFFTRRREGIGLGLAIAQRIAKEHGATLEAGNREAGGARVRVRLPVVEQAKKSRARKAR